MSVILDALRKLDREKSSRRKGTANIAVEILRPDLTHRGRRIPLYIVTVAVAAIARRHHVWRNVRVWVPVKVIAPHKQSRPCTKSAGDTCLPGVRSSIKVTGSSACESSCSKSTGSACFRSTCTGARRARGNESCITESPESRGKEGPR